MTAKEDAKVFSLVAKSASSSTAKSPESEDDIRKLMIDTLKDVIKRVESGETTACVLIEVRPDNEQCSTVIGDESDYAYIGRLHCAIDLMLANING